MIKLQATDLRCEDRRNPMGVESSVPHLSWVLRSSKRGECQAAYQVLVATSPESLTDDTADLWNSGKVETSQSTQVIYNGKPLPSMAVCYWTVRVWGNDGRESSWADYAFWVMGVLTSREWAARWIGAISDVEANLPPGKHYHLYLPENDADDPWLRRHPLADASIYLRKEIFVSEGLTRATVYICGLGAFELQVNGEHAGDHFLEPAWTDYANRCNYSTYDVTEKIQSGTNALGVLLGNSMYNVTGGRYAKFLASYGPPKMILQMVLEYDDGRLEMFVSDSTWLWKRSPITFNCIFGGEDYDATLETPSWSSPGIDTGDWQMVQLVEPPKGKLVSEVIEPRRVLRTLTPVMVTEPARDILVYDLGQNFAGRMRITVAGKRGVKIRMLPGELLDSRGFVDQRNMVHASKEKTTEFNYTINGQGANTKETWAPRFSYSGFRYLQIEFPNADSPVERPVIAEVVGEMISIDVEEIGSFACSCSSVMKVYHLIRSAIRSNLQSVVTDCPHREKLGWLEQTYLMGASIMYEFGLSVFNRKTLADIVDAQQDNGLVPDIAPEYVTFVDGFRDSPEWGSAIVLLPWLSYLHYLDIGIFEQYFDAMMAYMNYLRSQAVEGIINHGLGDWYDFGPKPSGHSQLTTAGVTGTAIFYQNCLALSKAARVLGREKDVVTLQGWAEGSKSAFNGRFLHPEKGYYDFNSQTANAMPLALGMVPHEVERQVIDHLVDNLRQNQHQITSGDIGHAYVLRALAKYGYHEDVLQSIRRTTGYGYMYQLEMGATTLAEAWDASPSSSQNHMMLGHALEWFYTGLGGLQIDERFPETHQFVIAPHPVGGIDWVSLHHNTIFGEIQLMWTLQDGKFVLELTVPLNTSALVYLKVDSPRFVKESGISVYEIPGNRFLFTENGYCVFKVQSGTYEFSMDWHA